MSTLPIHGIRTPRNQRDGPHPVWVCLRWTFCAVLAGGCPQLRRIGSFVPPKPCRSAQPSRAIGGSAHDHSGFQFFLSQNVDWQKIMWAHLRAYDTTLSVSRWPALMARMLSLQLARMCQAQAVQHRCFGYGVVGVSKQG